MRPMPRRDVGRSALAVAALAVALSACAQQDPPGIRVSKIEANLVFGVQKPDAPAGPANFQPPAMPLLPPEMPDFIAPPKYTGPPLTATPQCPKAGVNDFPEEAATLNVSPDRRPKIGGYRWTRGGTQSGAHTLGLTLPVGGFENRTVQNVVKTSDTLFSFDTVQTEFIGGETVTTTYQVKTNGTTSTGQVPPVPGGQQPPSAGDPERGLTITKIARKAKNGTTRVFQPVDTAGLLLFPLPIRVGEQFSSSAVDPGTFETISFNGTVGKVQRIDACGTVIEGFPVTGTQTFSAGSGGGETVTRTYSMVIAPQLGAIPIYEAVDQTGANGVYKLTFTIGQKDPNPLPKSSTGTR